ncbi:Homeobox-leucine zipper protein, partial [Trichinella pseudospiralis]
AGDVTVSRRMCRKVFVSVDTEFLCCVWCLYKYIVLLTLKICIFWNFQLGDCCLGVFGRMRNANSSMWC